MHEAYCSYDNAGKFRPYEKHHATCKDACQNAEKVNAKSIIIYHSVDNELETRKSRFIEEGSKVYSGTIYVPNDLEEIPL